MRYLICAGSIVVLMLLAPSRSVAADNKAGRNAPVVIPPGVPRTHTVRITQPRHQYTVKVGGTADMDSTTVLDYGDTQTIVGFRNNLSLEIENTGRTPVVNP